MWVGYSYCRRNKVQIWLITNVTDPKCTCWLCRCRCSPCCQMRGRTGTLNGNSMALLRTYTWFKTFDRNGPPMSGVLRLEKKRKFSSCTAVSKKRFTRQGFCLSNTNFPPDSQNGREAQHAKAMDRSLVNGFFLQWPRCLGNDCKRIPTTIGYSNIVVKLELQ